MTHLATLVRKIRPFAVILAAVSVACLSVHAQATPTTHVDPTASPTYPTDSAGFPTAPHDPEQARMMKDMGRQRNVLRQKEIIDDTEHLLDLAKQLKDAVDKSSKDQLSLSVVNTASEIEKLAKSVKEKMRDGQ